MSANGENVDAALGVIGHVCYEIQKEEAIGLSRCQVHSVFITKQMHLVLTAQAELHTYSRQTPP